MLEDRYQLPVSTPSSTARDAYVAGVDSVISGVAGYREHLAEALAADPQFALAHLALARGLFLDAEVALARESAARAQALAAQATPREQSHVNAIGLGLAGKPAQALQATLAHLQQWPRDAMVLAPATSVYGLYGFSGNAAHEEQLYQLLHSLAPAYGQDWWFDGVHAFAACETGRLDLAWALVERSLAAHSRNAHAAHFKVHVLYERGESAAALAYLEGWMPAYEKRGLMHCHLSWHLALAALTSGQRDRAWQAYREAVQPGAAWGPPINLVADTASFLWRAELAGEPRRAPLWQAVQAQVQRSFPRAGVAFIDAHGLLACVATDDRPALQQRVAEIQQRIANDGYPAGDVAVRLADGFAAYEAGDWPLAIRCLQQALPDTVRIGGSRAQRDLVELTLIAACIKAEQPEDAGLLIKRRSERWLPIGVGLGVG